MNWRGGSSSTGWGRCCVGSARPTDWAKPRPRTRSPRSGLKLVENIGSLRDGSAVPGWLITTLRRECLARASARSRERLLADFTGVDEPVDVIDFDRWLLDADRRQIVHRAMMKFSEQQRQLIGMLFADPTPSYAEISANLAMPIGSIGPTRQRLLGKLRDAMVDEEGRELANVG